MEWDRQGRKRRWVKGEWEVGKGEWGGGGLWLGSEGGWVQEMKV